MFGDAETDEANVDVAEVRVFERQRLETGISLTRQGDLQVGLGPGDITHIPSSLQDIHIQLTRSSVQSYKFRLGPYSRLSDWPKTHAGSDLCK
jgi:hypothetical protein